MTSPPVFVERLRVPLAWHALGGAAAVLLAGQVAVLYRHRSGAVIGTLVLAVAALELFLARLGRATVLVTDSFLRVEGADLDLAELESVEPLDARAMRQALGLGRSRDVHACTRGYIPGGVLLRTSAGPWWLVSSRAPEALSAAVAASRRAAPGPDADGSAG